MIELNGIQISDNNINTKKNVKIYTDEKQLSNVVNKEVHALKGALKDLHTPIAISTENTTESMAQNVRNIADFVAKAKAAGIDTTKSLRLTLEIDSYPVEGSYDPNNEWIYGLELTDDNFARIYLIEPNSGSVRKNELVTELSEQTITSSMLTEGARKPIILTPDTTEVDEETYQKLLSDDVDVVFKAQDGDANICLLTYKYDNGDVWSFIFSCLSVEGTTLTDTYLYGYKVSINETAPHKATIETFFDVDIHTIIDNSGFIHKSTLSPVLKEIDLTGTDAERKARLDQFEEDWKALTSASSLAGARFVGKVDTPSGISTMVFTWNDSLTCYTGIGFDDTKRDYKGMVLSDGTIYISPIFSHLEPITIKTGSDAADIAANKAAIEEYDNNLSMELGLGTYQGYQVSVVVISNGEKYVGTLNKGTGPLLMGIVTDVNETHHYPFHIEAKTGIVTFDKTNYFLEKTSNEVTEMLDAIKYSYTPVPLTATTSTNKTQLDLFLSKVPNAQVMHCTYKDMYAGTLHKINGSWYGVLVSESNTLAGQLSIKLQADGTIVEGTA